MKNQENIRKKKELAETLKRLGVIQEDSIGCVTLHIHEGGVTKVIPALEALRS